MDRIKACRTIYWASVGFQTINIFVSGFGTGTQGSFDSYMISAVIGTFLGMTIGITGIVSNKSRIQRWEIITSVVIGVILIIQQWPYLLNVLIRDRKIADVMANTVHLNIPFSKPGIIERLLPAYMIVLVLEIVVIMAIRATREIEKET